MASDETNDVTVAEAVTSLLGSTGVAAYEFVGRGDVAWLDDVDAKQMAAAVENRQREFATGRRCARSALAALGFGSTTLPVGEKREPIWPSGAIGSITHTSGYCLAAVAEIDAVDFSGLGVDAERIGRVGSELFGRLFTEPERAVLDSLDAAERRTTATEWFSAKEAFYKAQFPRSRSWVGFQDVSIRRTPHGLTIDRASAMDALDHVAWPVQAKVIRRDDLVITVVTTHARRGNHPRLAT